jgi:hypothetical protein
MCATATAGVGGLVVLAPCNPNIRTVSQAEAVGLPSYRGWSNQSFYVSNCGSYNGAGRMTLAYVTARINGITANLCVGEASGALSIDPCLDMTGHDFTTTLSTVWGLYSPGNGCQGAPAVPSSSNVSTASVLRDDTTINPTLCVDVVVAAASAPAPGPCIPCTFLMTLAGECVCPSSTFGANGCVDGCGGGSGPPPPPEPEPEPDPALAGGSCVCNMDPAAVCSSRPEICAALAPADGQLGVPGESGCVHNIAGCFLSSAAGKFAQAIRLCL